MALRVGDRGVDFDVVHLDAERRSRRRRRRLRRLLAVHRSDGDDPREQDEGKSGSHGSRIIAPPYTWAVMALDVEAIRRALAAEGLDGWLLYDFHGSNPIAAQLTGLAGGPHMTTRRWYYLIPASGEPRALVHAIERHNLAHLPGSTAVYAGRDQLEAGLTQLLAGMQRVA